MRRAGAIQVSDPLAMIFRDVLDRKSRAQRLVIAPIRGRRAAAGEEDKVLRRGA